MWLWAAWRGHLVVCVSRQLRHLLALIPLAVSRQHGHCHRRHRHGNGIPWLPGCHQGEQVPATECELNRSIQDLLSKTHMNHYTQQPLIQLLSYPLPAPPDICCWRSSSSHMQILAETVSHICVDTPTHAVHRPTRSPITICLPAGTTVAGGEWQEEFSVHCVEPQGLTKED